MVLGVVESFRDLYPIFTLTIKMVIRVRISAAIFEIIHYAHVSGWIRLRVVVVLFRSGICFCDGGEHRGGYANLD